MRSTGCGYHDCTTCWPSALGRWPVDLKMASRLSTWHEKTWTFCDLPFTRKGHRACTEQTNGRTTDRRRDAYLLYREGAIQKLAILNGYSCVIDEWKSATKLHIVCSLLLAIKSRNGKQQRLASSSAHCSRRICNLYITCDNASCNVIQRSRGYTDKSYSFHMKSGQVSLAGFQLLKLHATTTTLYSVACNPFSCKSRSYLPSCLW